jgi:O-acetyl-ADP-ribose deacetylase (regulator of RNase III)
MELPDEPYSVTVNVGDPEVLRLVQGDITQYGAGAIVNAANSALRVGGGVDHSIHAAGGPTILEECNKIREQQGSLPPGQAVATSAGKLRADYVIHTVGPIWRGGNEGESDLLASCYRQCFRIAEELKLGDIVFPALSTGAFGYPVEQAAWVAIPTVIDCLRRSKRVCHATFVLYDRKTLDVFAQVAMAQRRPGSGAPYEVMIGTWSVKS